jgi:amino acid transporter
MSTAMTGAVHDRGDLFTRKATGLVRQVSPKSALIFNMLTAPAPFVLAIAIFWSLGAFPGGNLYIAFTVGYGCGMIFAFAVSTLSAAMPRSGGDYVLVGRTIHPAVGLVSSFCFTGGVLISIAFLTLTIVTAAIAPTMSVIGLIGGSQWWLDAASTLSTNKTVIFFVGVGALLLCGAIIAAGWRWSLRFQNWGAAFVGIGLLVTAIVLLLNSGDDFVSKFNQFAGPITDKSDSYGSIIASAQKEGVATDPAFSMSATWPCIGAVIGFSMYGWFSAHIGGEVRQASSWKASFTMFGAAFLNYVLVVVLTLIFFHAFGGEFFRAINGINGTEAYPFAAPPFYVFLASIAGGSTFLAVVIGASFLVCILLVLWLNLVQPIRALFAWAFDGILPLRVAYVSPRSRIPVVALVITLAISIALYAWAVWSASAFEVYATAVVVTVAALILLAVSAIILPYRRPEIWKASLTQRRLLGVPLTSWAGVLALIIALFNGYLFLHYRGLGLPDPADGWRNVGIVVAAALIVYGIASWVRGRQGVSLSKAASEVPAE